MKARDTANPLHEEYSTKLWSWVREQQVALLHAWACTLGIKLHLTAFDEKSSYLSSMKPMSSNLVLGSDLDPASTDDFRHLIAHTLASDGFVVAGIQLTEVNEESAAAEATKTLAAQPDHRHHHHHHEAHHGVRGNAYNFASTALHVASFDLVQGQLASIPCIRSAEEEALACVEVCLHTTPYHT